jgi:5-oxoprolinase (ATP-hydrolysing) subunit C
VIEIIRPGPLASVQDKGRTGYRNIGVGVSGAMDDLARRIANLMVGNDEDLAVIEVTLGGIELRFEENCTFAVTGADADFMLDGEALPAWWCVTAQAGQVLKASAPRAGMRSYIGVSGGIDVPTLLGARATDLKAGFGGHDGRGLTAGDRLAVGQVGSTLAKPFGLSASRLQLDVKARSGPEGERIIRMLPAAEWNDYGASAQQLFLSTLWKIDPASNRVGIRLNGPDLNPAKSRELLSHGILPGTIQVPPSGKPIVQLCDANTMGGYPKLGVVITADLHLLAQARLGGTLRFEIIDREAALIAVRDQEKRLDRIRTLIASARAVSGEGKK